MKKNGTVNIEKFIEHALDKISSTGENVGSKLGTMGYSAKRILLGVGILIIFGIAAFIWAFGRGLVKPKK